MNTSDLEQKKMAKMDLVSISSELMPKGAPNYPGVIKYPPIERLCQEIGKKVPLLSILVLVRDFCSSINVVRNMNEDQMIETASMLLDECGNFRLEDYVMMFSLAKRSQLVKIYDHVDIGFIGECLDEYWQRRNLAGKVAQEDEYKDFEENLSLLRKKPEFTPEETRLQDEIMDKMKKLSKEMQEDAQVEVDGEFARRDERIKKYQSHVYDNMSPAEQQYMQQIRASTRKAPIVVDENIKTDDVLIPPQP